MPSPRTRLKVLLMRWPALYRWARRGAVLGRYLAGRPHEPDFRAFAGTPDTGLFLDVGANSGLSALSFRTQNRRMPILSIEANRFHEPDLKLLRRVLPAYDYRIVAAGDRADELRLHVPVYNGVPLTGEASVLELRDDDLRWWADEHFGRPVSFDFREVEVRAVPLDELEVDPTIVKIDVEGFELPVLRGLVRTLERCRPLLMLERPKGAKFDEVAAFLARWGYEARRRADDGRLVPLDGPTLNVFYVPPGWDDRDRRGARAPA